MNRTKWIYLVIALAMMGVSAVLLANFKNNRKLGEPGVKTRPIPESKDPVKVEVVLPEKVLDYDSVIQHQTEVVTNTLPPDTSYGDRIYTAADRFQTQVGVVLMGRDRTSHHKPQYCLTGGGWNINPNASKRETIAMEKPVPYDLPVMKLIVSRQVEREGQKINQGGVFIYWFVADGKLSGDESGFERMWEMAKGLLTTGKLQRWAYVIYFSVCPPGQEDATFERMKKLIAASVPEFQLTPASQERVAAKE